ncbi:hypothetical protein ACFWN1_06085 [Streptomyces sp. NPDC058459]|uniref:hypothetical protein n=1 Tax=Streptomyces sp. NPDC058459 TaxID=3346508 RepID=UPI00364E8FA8
MGLKPWGRLSTSLVVTGEGVHSGLLISAMRLGGDFSLPEGVGIYSGPGWATLTVHDRDAESADEQVTELLGFLRSREPELDALRQAGRSVQVDVSGVGSEPGSGLHFSPAVLTGLADLGIPVTFTTVTESGADPEDPLAWLDA